MSPLMHGIVYGLLVAGLLAIALILWVMARAGVAVLRELRSLERIERARGEHLPPEYRPTNRERAGLMRGDTTHPKERTR